MLVIKEYDKGKFMADISDLDENTDPQPTDEMYLLDNPGVSENDERITYLTAMTLGALIGGLERSADPPEPAEGFYVIWMSDGTEKGDDGDVLIASNPDGTTKFGTIFDYSGGGGW